jgi:hypothetical protein
VGYVVSSGRSHEMKCKSAYVEGSGHGVCARGHGIFRSCHGILQREWSWHLSKGVSRNIWELS